MSELGRDIGPPRADHVRKPVGWYLAWVGSCAFGFFGVWYAFQLGLGYDSHAYWLAVQDMGRLYGAPALARDAFLYSPAFAQLIWPGVPALTTIVRVASRARCISAVATPSTIAKPGSA